MRVGPGLSVNALHEAGKRIEVAFSEGDSGADDLVVGVDGANSGIRRRLLPEHPMLTFTGQGCWRALASRPPEVNHSYIYAGHGCRAGINPVSEEQIYLFFLEHVAANPWCSQDELLDGLKAGLAPFGGLVAQVREGLSAASEISYCPLEPGLLPAPWNKGRAVLIGDAAHVTTPHLASAPVWR